MKIETEEYETTNQVKAKHEPTKWYVVVHLVDGKVKPQIDWRRSMKVGDEVYFLSPDGDAQVRFTPEEAKLQGGEKIVNNLYPFGKDNLVIHGDKKIAYRVVHSCKALMTCSIVKDKVVYTWKGALAPTASPQEWMDDEYAEGGTHICTGGGNTPVVCT